jgi:hypothetical protein
MYMYRFIHILRLVQYLFGPCFTHTQTRTNGPEVGTHVRQPNRVEKVFDRQLAARVTHLRCDVCLLYNNSDFVHQVHTAQYLRPRTERLTRSWR